MPATMERINEFLENKADWTDSERAVIEWQFRLCGDFRTALWNAIKQADDLNLCKLALGFPIEVDGFLAWSRGDLGQRLRAAGLEI